MKFDLHIHTDRHSSDSRLDPFELLERARELGLDGFAITEHDYLWTEDELRELRYAAPGMVILAGVEVSAHRGHVLCYGVSDPFALPKNIPWADLCREIHRQGGVAVAAHPFRWDQPFERIVADEGPELDGLEMMSSNMDDGVRARAAEFRGRHPRLATLGNSDAHDAATVGFCFTDIEAEVATVADLVSAIRAGKCSPWPRLPQPVSG